MPKQMQTPVVQTHSGGSNPFKQLMGMGASMLGTVFGGPTGGAIAGGVTNALLGGGGGSQLGTTLGGLMNRDSGQQDSNGGFMDPISSGSQMGQGLGDMLSGQQDQGPSQYLMDGQQDPRSQKFGDMNDNGGSSLQDNNYYNDYGSPSLDTYSYGEPTDDPSHSLVQDWISEVESSGGQAGQELGRLLKSNPQLMDGLIQKMQKG